MIRPAAVAGSWYPGTAEALARAVDGYLSVASADGGVAVRFADRPHRAPCRPDLLRPGRRLRVPPALRPDVRRDRAGGSLSFRRVRWRCGVPCRRIPDAVGRRGDRRTLRGRDHGRCADRPRARRGACARALARNAAAVPAAAGAGCADRAAGDGISVGGYGPRPGPRARRGPRRPPRAPGRQHRSVALSRCRRPRRAWTRW